MQDIIKLETFTVASLILVTIALFLTHKYVKPEKRKYVYMANAFCCVATHYSAYIIDLCKGTAGEIPGNLFLPEWPCNIMMWLIFTISFLWFFRGKAVLRDFLYITAWAGTICAVVGIAANTNYFANPDWTDWEILKGLISHIFLLYCCVYPFVEGLVPYDFFKISKALLLSAGLFIVCGNYSQFVLKLLKRETGGGMLASPFESAPWLNLYCIIAICLAAWTLIATVYEILRFEKGHRWYNRCKY